MAIVTAGAASAELLTRYDTAGVSAGVSSIFDSAAYADMTASAMTMTSLLNNKAPNSFTAWDWTQPTPSAALANDEYISFSVVADSGYQLNLDSLDLVLFYQNGQGDSADWAIYSSIDNFASALDSGFDLQGGTYTSANIDLSATEFDAVTDPLEFRISFGDVAAVWTYAGVSTDNTSAEWPKPSAAGLNGVVEAIPEPAVVSLIALFGGGLLFIRRRFK